MSSERVSFPFEKGIRFECLKNCALCCHFKVEVSPQEADKLPKESLVIEKGKRFLKRVGGKCIFLKNSLCSIYPSRPLLCRLYPFLDDTLFSPGMDIDLTCPGVGEGKFFPVEEIYSLRERKTFPQIEKIKKILLQRGIYSSPDESRERVKNWLASSPLEEELAHSLHRLNLKVYLSEELPLPIWGTIKKGKKVILYKMEVKKEGISLSPFSSFFPWTQIKEAELNTEGFKEIRNYLDIMLKRQFPFRLVFYRSLISPLPLKTGDLYEEFFRKTALTLYILAKAIGAREGKRAGKEEVKEAIRVLDAPLRQRCQVQFIF